MYPNTEQERADNILAQIKRLVEAESAIQRVRELAYHWLNGQSKDIPYDSDQFAKALLKALEGEQ